MNVLGAFYHFWFYERKFEKWYISLLVLYIYEYRNHTYLCSAINQRVSNVNYCFRTDVQLFSIFISFFTKRVSTFKSVQLFLEQLKSQAIDEQSVYSHSVIVHRKWNKTILLFSNFLTKCFLIIKIRWTACETFLKIVWKKIVHFATIQKLITIIGVFREGA